MEPRPSNDAPRDNTSAGPRAFRAPAVAVLVSALVGLTAAVIALAAATRPIDRGALPTQPEAVQADLAALHQGEGPCVRWPGQAPLSEAERGAFLEDLEGLLVLDLRTLLPVLAAVRQQNHREAGRHHRLSRRQEFVDVARARLSSADRLRLRLNPDLVEEVLPRAATLAPDPVAVARDARMAARLRARLTPDERRRLDAIVARWRAPLASPLAQADLVERTAESVNAARMGALRQGLLNYRDHFGRFPPDLPSLVRHLRNIERLPPVVERGLAPDGSLRDGWLRPYAYYPAGRDDFRLISHGPSPGSDEDDAVMVR